MSSLAPENTLVAAELCREVGADGWECDVQLTGDGVPVLLHDATLQRTTNVAEIFPERAHLGVSHFTLQEVRRLDAGSWFMARDPYGTVAKRELSDRWMRAFSGTRIPTLEEALLLSKRLGLRVIIELKAMLWQPFHNLWLLERTLSMVSKLNMDRDVLISSFDATLIRQLKKRAPHVAGALLTESIPRNPVRYLEGIGADALSLKKDAFDEHLVEEIAASGFGVFVWTVNEPEELAYFLRNRCVQGIITDWPQVVTGSSSFPRFQ